MMNITLTDDDAEALRALLPELREDATDMIANLQRDDTYAGDQQRKIYSARLVLIERLTAATN